VPKCDVAEGAWPEGKVRFICEALGVMVGEVLELCDGLELDELLREVLEELSGARPTYAPEPCTSTGECAPGGIAPRSVDDDPPNGDLRLGRAEGWLPWRGTVKSGAAAPAAKKIV
jgi:hypothetical protein